MGGGRNEDVKLQFEKIWHGTKKKYIYVECKQDIVRRWQEKKIRAKVLIKWRKEENCLQIKIFTERN